MKPWNKTRAGWLKSFIKAGYGFIYNKRDYHRTNASLEEEPERNDSPLLVLWGMAVVNYLLGGAPSLFHHPDVVGKRHLKQRSCDAGHESFLVLWTVHRRWCAEKILPRYFYNHSQWSKSDPWNRQRGLSIPYVSHVLWSHVLVSLSCKGGDFGDPRMPHVVAVCPPAAPGRKLLKVKLLEVSPAAGNPQLHCLEGRCLAYLPSLRRDP